MSHLREREVFAKTIYGEARGEIDKGKIAVAWVIKNRAAKNKSFWGGNTIKGVCLAPNQFECWNGRSDITINEPEVYKKILELCNRIYDTNSPGDPTGGCEYYNNPDKEGFPAWTKNTDFGPKIGNHQFYKSKPGFV